MKITWRRIVKAWFPLTLGLVLLLGLSMCRGWICIGSQPPCMTMRVMAGMILMGEISTKMMTRIQMGAIEKVGARMAREKEQTKVEASLTAWTS